MREAIPMPKKGLVRPVTVLAWAVPVPDGTRLAPDLSGSGGLATQASMPP